MRLYYTSIVVSSALFLFYGIACLAFDRMKRDFERFGLSHLRTLTGTLEVLGALGLVAGLFWPPLVPLSAGGLALMMLLGMVARIRVLDSLAQTLPALVLMLVNLFIVWYALGLAGRDG
jgi:energy-coupling factor transporter transmembrane protein EcfT